MERRVMALEHILMRMQDTAQQYVEILRDILGIDVSIIDAHQIRVAGSGRMKARTGSMASYGSIVRHTLDTKSITVVEDPIINPICAGCGARDWCDNLCEMWAPIMLDGEAIGVIGCVCYNQEQKEMFLERRKTFEQFFIQFAGLLENRAHDLLDVDRHQNVRAMLEHVLERAQIGSLILDSDGKIIDINQLGKQLLQLREDHTDYTKLTIRGVGQEAPKEYLIQSRDSVHRVVADIYKISMAPYDRLVLFGDAELRSDISDGLLGLTPTNDLDRIIGQSKEIRALKKDICIVAESHSNVLVTGESGTGKELVARAIHGESQRKDGPFVAVNCAALPENLLESELFGYVKGAFTGASSNGKVGLLEAAQDGTFFLDEVGEMPLSLQVKLLRVLEQREITRLGSNKPTPINARFVFATNRDLAEMVQEGTFRKDLYYRINVVPLSIPPLRERPGDIRLIAGSFIRKFSVAMNKPCRKIGEDFWDALEGYDWPGNVRELQNTVEFAVNMMPSSGILRSELLRNKIHAAIQEHAAVSALEKKREDWNLERAEAEIIRQCLAQYADKRLAAQKLGIGLATLYRKMKAYDL